VSRSCPQELEAAGVETTADLRTRAPNLIVQEAGDRRSNVFSIRGLGNTPIAGASVGLYVDGIPIVDQRAALIPLYDVEEVDVFRGPQNLRFGRSADGGAISVLTRPPGSELAARGSVLYGNFDTQIYEGAVGGPLGSDRVRFSLAGLESRRDGYIRNTFLHEPLDDRDLLAGRGKLLLLPAPELEVALVGEAQHADEGSWALVSEGEPDPFRVAYNTPGHERTDAYLGAVRAAYAAPLFRLTSLTARRSFNADRSQFDLDLSPRNLLVVADDHRYLDWTEELRVASPDPEARWRWQLGGFFEDTVTEPRLTFQVNDTGFIQAPPPVGLGLPFTAPLLNTQDARLHARAFAGFGELTTTALVPLELTAGLRYQHDDVEMSRQHTIDAVAQGTVLAVVPPFQLDTASSAWLPQLTAGWRVRPPLLVYASVARGYRPAGFSYYVDDPAIAPFEAQRDWSGETGAKGAWLDGRLLADLALFYIVSRDFQVVRRAGLTSFQVVNAERVTSRGLDASVLAEPWRGLDVSAAVGYIHARYDDFQLPTSGRRLDGNDVQLVPPYSFSLALEYRHRTGVLARAEYQGLGAYAFTEENNGGQGAYELVNARLGWAQEHVGAYLFAKNLTDTTYFPFAIPGGSGGRFIVAPGAPRTFGFVVTATF
jgi:iron complex outermembrane receptor protein